VAVIRVALTVGIAVLTASPAAAQHPACMPIEQVQKILRENYRDVPLLMARIDDGNVLVFYATDKGV